MEMHIAISKGFDYDMKGCKRNLIVLINSIDGIVDYVENKVNFLVVQKLKWLSLILRKHMVFIENFMKC